MTIGDLRCDVCGRVLAGPAAGPGPVSRHGAAGADPIPSARGPAAVRFVYDPGVAELRDDSGLACEPCWSRLVAGFSGAGTPGRCAVCGEPVSRHASLRLRRSGDPRPWRLCAGHAVGFLNALRTVRPKLDPATFRFPLQDRP
jgi:ribosomal protein S27E